MAVDDPLDELASSVSDGSAVDWESAESSAAGEQRASVRALRDLARIADFNRALQRSVREAAGSVAASPGPSAWGPFTLLEAVGAGANGEVWRAWDSSLHREVAIKFLQGGGDRGSRPAQAALLDEARALARVRHPGIVHVYGIGEYDGRVGMWMEFLRGSTLAHEIERSGGKPPREVARIGALLSGALEALDQGGLVHRDIKPSNVVLEADGRVALTDFGLGSRLTFLPERSPASTSGTPLFMAPSLLDGGSPTPRTDLYALGATLRWALTGRPPFRARTMEELREQARLGPGPLAAESPDAPPALIDAIERAMDVSPGAPPYHAGAMRAALSAVVDELGAERRPPSTATSSSQLPTRPSIAVLPFLNRGLDASDEYFADGLADELVNVLSKIRGLHVAARTSSFRFKGKHVDLGDIGRALRVATILEGSVRKSVDRVRISARLVHVASGEQLWTETYDRTLEDIFAVQDEIAQRVVEELRAALLPTPRRGSVSSVPGEVATAMRGRGRDAEAHRLYILGRHFALGRTLEGLKKAVELLEQATERDPTHAMAWAELGNAYATMEDHGLLPPMEGYRRGREAILRALAIEPELPEGHARIGRIQAVRERDWRGAEASFRRALSGDPGNATALHGAAIVAQGLGRSDEAIELNLRAIAVDPLSGMTYNNLGAVYYESGRLEESEQAFRTSLELAPSRMGTRSFLAQVLARQGRLEEAMAEVGQEPDDVFRLLALVLVHHVAGRKGESDEAMRELTAKHGELSPGQVAEAHGVRGEADEVFQWLEKAVRQGDAALAHLRQSPHFRSVHSDPRWAVILAKVGLAE